MAIWIWGFDILVLIFLFFVLEKREFWLSLCGTIAGILIAWTIWTIYDLNVATKNIQKSQQSIEKKLEKYNY